MRISIALLLGAASLLPAAEVPRQSPEYVFELPNKQQELLSKYKGKVVVLEFLFTTCPHCQNTAKILSKMQRELGPKGFQAIGVAINDKADVPGFIAQYGVNFPVGTGSRDSAYSYLQQSMVSSFYVPQIVIIDRKGVIRGQHTGTDAFIAQGEETNLRTAVGKLMAEPGSSTSTSKARRKASS